jgi:hypothetical protein
MSYFKSYVSAGLGGKDYMSFELKNIEDDKQSYNWKGSKLADYSFISEHLKDLTGKILTIIDASIPEGKQNKCVKDLIRNEFMKKFSDVSEILIDLGDKLDNPKQNEIPEIVSAKEILEA